jgi:hypothetical protein
MGIPSMKWMRFSTLADFTCPPKEPLFHVFFDNNIHTTTPRPRGGFISALSDDVFIDREESKPPEKRL